MKAEPWSLFQRADPHDPDRAAFDTGTRQISFRECMAAAGRVRHALTTYGLGAHDAILSSLPAGPYLAALLLASWTSNLRLTLVDPATIDRIGRASLSTFKLLIHDGTGADQRIASISVDALFRTGEAGASALAFADAVDGMHVAVLQEGRPMMLDAAGLRRSIENFSRICPVRAGDTLLSGSRPFTLAGAFASMVMPLVLGLTARHLGGQPGRVPEDWTLFQTADLCELPASSWSTISKDRSAAVPARSRALICGSGELDPAAADAIERVLGRPVEQGLGTVETGLWAVSLGAGDKPPTGFQAEIRPLRSPLQLMGAEGAVGEIVLRSDGLDATPRHTGLVGWRRPTGALVVAGSLSDVAVRGGRAFLLSDHDRLLHRFGVRASRTFLQEGKSPTERVCCVALVEPASGAGAVTLSAEATTAPGELRAIADRAAAEFAGATSVVDQVVPISGCEGLPSLRGLRALASGTARRAVVKALTARRFRRNPAYNEAGLAAAVDRALLGEGTLDFLMFWGCGPRRLAAGPDRAAIDALAELLAAAEAAAPVRARARVICTDLHATNNGHPEVHYRTYFGEIAALADRLDVTFEMESAVWARGGLSKAQVSALEQTPEFIARWSTFALHDRFIHQAEKHSGMADKIAAARHYYATCLLEREVLKALFPNSVFLTYNGPDFNECFPDLPTLYVYPGPRGPNDKPWFVDISAVEADEHGLVQVAAA